MRMSRILRNNELEMMLKCAKKALKKSIEENPKSGLIINKGEDNEARMRYTEALENLDWVYYLLKGKDMLKGECCRYCRYYSFRENACWSVCNEGQGRVEVQHYYDWCNKFKPKKVKK
jgi:hypothetical protein